MPATATSSIGLRGLGLLGSWKGGGSWNQNPGSSDGFRGDRLGPKKALPPIGKVSFEQWQGDFFEAEPIRLPLTQHLH